MMLARREPSANRPPNRSTGSANPTHLLILEALERVRVRRARLCKARVQVPGPPAKMNVVTSRAPTFFRACERCGTEAGSGRGGKGAGSTVWYAHRRTAEVKARNGGGGRGGGG